MTKIATSFVNHYKLTLQTSLSQLSSYVEELASKLSNGKTKEQTRKAKDQAKRCFQELGLKINRIAYNLASFAPTTISGNSQLNLLQKTNHIQARKRILCGINGYESQRSIPDKFPFLLKDKDRNTNIVPLNQFLSCHRITSFILRKVGADHAFRVHGVEHYGVINDRPNTLAPNQENGEVEDIIDLYREISNDDS
ncbi:6986_t:CDS:2 [Gigaspora rosea]|nr:6986_t:CDS:2 [Gigaspora rosea]